MFLDVPVSCPCYMLWKCTCIYSLLCPRIVAVLMYIHCLHCLLICRKQISVPVRVQGLERVRLIAVGAFHNLALQEDGTLWAWGNNEYGQLGTGDTQPRSQPITVQGLSGLTLVCITFLNPLTFDDFLPSISLGMVTCIIQFLKKKLI